jgi:hypothetical protein
MILDPADSIFSPAMITAAYCNGVIKYRAIIDAIKIPVY